MFNNWLLEKLKEKGWSQAEFARHSGLTKGAISNYVNGRTPDRSALLKIAKTFKVPIETVFRAANLLPLEISKNEIIEEINFLIKDLPNQEQEDILEFVKLRHNITEQRNETKRIARHSTVTK